MKRITVFLLVLGAFMISTCGAADNVLRRRVADTKFSRDRGFYATAFELSITCATPGAMVLYTLDGSEPTPENGSATTSPAVIRITTTTVVRAKAVHPDYEPTNTDTQSYIFLNDVIHQPAVVPGYPNPWSWMGGDRYTLHDYEMDPEIVNDPAYRDMILDALRAIPTMSIVANPEYLNDFYWGQRERPCSVEIIDPCNPKQSEQANAGIEPHSHDRLKRSLRLNFRAEYGPSKFKTSLFRHAPFHGDTATDTVDRIILRGGNNRCWARFWNPDKTAYTIDQFYRDLQIAMSGHGARGTFAHLYINGLYWGLYNPTERPDHWFASEYFGGQVEDWFSCNHAGTLQGDRTRFDYLTKILVDMDLTDPANYEQVKEYLDVDNFIDYLLVTWWMGVGDWPNNNWYAANRNEDSPLGPTGLRFFAWDGEWSWDASRADGPGAVHPDFRSGKTGGSTIPKLWHALRRNDDFMMRFADRAYQHLRHNGALADENAQVRWLALNEFVRDAVVAESARWGDAMEPHGQPARTRDLDWQREVDAIYHMIEGTRDMFLANLRAEGYYPQLDPPVFNQRGGQVDDGFALALVNPNPSGNIWYTLDGSDPRRPGQFQGTPGARQRHPTNEPIATGAMAYDGPITVDKTVRVKARVLDGATWSALEDVTFTPQSVAQGLRVTEIMYHPTDPNAEFIELCNIGATAINLQFVQFTEGVSFVCPDVTLTAGKCALVVADIQTFESRYEQGLPLLGQYTGRLSNSGERLTLTDAVGQTILDFAYDDDWFDLTDGRGYSLVVTDPNLDASLWSHKANWGPSALPGGSPGTN